ncbi:unnamed protein product, partial [Tetraodon nigroviridis]
MESARGAFHAQLATVMDSLLAAAVCEIAKIFESSLCEQQAELAHKSQEISVLRGKLEKVERRQRAKGGGAEEGQGSAGDRAEQSQPAAGSVGGTALPGGPNVEKGSSSSQTDSLEGHSRLKEEVTSQDAASLKPEHSGSDSVLRPAVAEGYPAAAADQRAMDTPTAPQAKVKCKRRSCHFMSVEYRDGVEILQRCFRCVSPSAVSHWDQDSCSVEHKPAKDPSLSPFLSISRSGRCSPRSDPSQEWLLRLDASHSGVSSLQSLQADGTGCSAPPDHRADAETSFQPDFGSDESSSEEDGSFPFLDQEPENHNSSHHPADSQDAGQRAARQIPPPASSAESTWRQRDDPAGRGPAAGPRRAAPFGNREPLRRQSNLQLLAVRHSNASSPAASAGSGRPYPCPYCTKSFTYPSHQRRHLLRHTGVRLHPCQFCEKSFLTPSELTVHTRTHTGERPFACSQCGKRFARSGNLRAHQRDVHMGKRPFACSECGKRFAHRGNLRVHNHRVHQGDPYY